MGAHFFKDLPESILYRLFLADIFAKMRLKRVRKSWATVACCQPLLECALLLVRQNPATVWLGSGDPRFANGLPSRYLQVKKLLGTRRRIESQVEAPNITSTRELLVQFVDHISDHDLDFGLSVIRQITVVRND